MIIDSLHIPGYIGDFNPVIGVRKIFQSSLTMTSRNHWDQLVIEHLHFVSIDGVLTWKKHIRWLIDRVITHISIYHILMILHKTSISPYNQHIITIFKVFFCQRSPFLPGHGGTRPAWRQRLLAKLRLRDVREEPQILGGSWSWKVRPSRCR